MHTLFNPENKFWVFMGKITDVACMSVLWLLTSLPIFTIGASTAAFYSFTMEAVRDQEGGVLRSYFAGFRKYFKKATLLWLGELALLLLLGVNLYAAANLYLAHGVIALGALSLAICGVFLLLGTVCYLYPLLVSYDFPLKKVICDSFVMAVRNPHVTVSCLVLFALAGVASVYISGLFFFWLGLAIFFCSYFMLGVFLKNAGVKVEKKKKKHKNRLPHPDL